MKPSSLCSNYTSTHFTSSRSPSPGRPRTPTVSALNQLTPSVSPVTGAVLFSSHRTPRPRALFSTTRSASFSGFFGKHPPRHATAEQPHHRYQQEQAHQSQGYDLYDGHTSPPFIAPAATQGGTVGSVFSTGTACGMPEGTLWPFCSLIRRSR